MTDPNELLDISAAAEFLKVSETSLRRWTNAGVLPCLRVGRRRERRFRRSDLVAFMEDSPPARRPASAKRSSASQRGSRNEPITVTLGNHLCGIYGSNAGRIALFAPFLLEGLREGSICLVFAPSRVQKEIVKSLEEGRPGLASDIKEGRLIVNVFQKSSSAQWKFMKLQLSDAQKAGGSSLRVAGDMVGLRTHVSAGQLVKFEAGLDDKIVARFPVAILCAYDARKFSGVELVNALKMHRDTFRYPLGRLLE
jgi:excisionase family DNA binding protein